MPAWLMFALGSALFAALTAVLAKVGVADISSNAATFIRVAILVPVLAAVVLATNAWPPVINARTWTFLALSAFATGASWLCYFRALQLGDVARVGSIDRLSVVAVALIGVLFLGEKFSAANWVGVALIGAGAVLVAHKA